MTEKRRDTVAARGYPFHLIAVASTSLIWREFLVQMAREMNPPFETGSSTNEVLSSSNQ
jgi:hypothetical protein